MKRYIPGNGKLPAACGMPVSRQVRTRMKMDSSPNVDKAARSVTINFGECDFVAYWILRDMRPVKRRDRRRYYE